VRMNAKKKVMLALFVVTIILGGLFVARGYPDWALNVMQKEGTTFVVTGEVDANITNTEINAYVTNSTITIEPSEGAEFIIKPAEAVVFQIQGQVDANITNSSLDVNVTNSEITIKPASGTVFTISPDSAAVFNVQGSVDANITNTELDVHVTNSTITIEPAAETVFEVKPATGAVFNIQGDVNITNTELDVHVTNSTLNVTGDVNATIQGTADINIKNAEVTVDVATLRERAPERGKVDYASNSVKVAAGTAESLTVFENTLGQTVYLELASIMFYRQVTESGSIDYASKFARIEIYDANDSLLVSIYVSPYTNVVPFDPAIPIEPNGKIVVHAWNTGSDDAYVAASIVYRKG